VKARAAAICASILVAFTLATRTNAQAVPPDSGPCDNQGQIAAVEHSFIQVVDRTLGTHDDTVQLNWCRTMVLRSRTFTLDYSWYPDFSQAGDSLTLSGATVPGPGGAPSSLLPLTAPIDVQLHVAKNGRNWSAGFPLAATTQFALTLLPPIKGSAPAPKQGP
jgi:hypothetical protein